MFIGATIKYRNSGTAKQGQTCALDLQHCRHIALGCAVLLVACRGKDIGSGLMKHIVQGSTANIYLTTLRKTIPFYEAAGFKLLQASEVPW